jgi:hypothetical protein
MANAIEMGQLGHQPQRFHAHGPEGVIVALAEPLS